MLKEKFREDDLFCPKCHCPQEDALDVSELEGTYNCEVCGMVFNYKYNQLTKQWSSFEEV